MRKGSRFGIAVAALALLTGAADPDNPSCPANPDFGPAVPMTLTPADRGGGRVLLAEGKIDASLPARLRKALEADETIGEVWIRSAGGDARAGNEAGKVIRSFPGMLTRIPSGWACFSACNFLFMGGDRRVVEPGGVFMVHMFTHTNQRDVIQETIAEGTNATAELIGEIEQSSAQLASDDNDFLIRMGVSRKLLTDVMYKQQALKTEGNPTTRYCLTQEEVRRYNVMPEERSL
ncbi:hypothetical protein GCM10011515_06720 [Tsuneonella deserti]|uniref:Peptidase S14 n=1 Tax=Tsuneonella deserti TaxID=2035528 RepID=A0ABQ1S3B1_9SPHN|nr:hypothetical protein [Tsuneonella deserti]GGD89774.1 hypothetical protein GCM10011515_06720 [Tsuneonella deserti]